MNVILRILHRFIIADRGTVYMVADYGHSKICMGDIFYDLQSNRFKVKGIEMIRYISEKANREDMPVGLLFEQMDGIEAKGNILVRSLKDISFIFCSHPLYTNRVDEDYMEEYQAAGAEHACALFSYEDMMEGKLSLYGEPVSGLTIYRGWMMKPAQYSDFYNQLAKKGIILINTPEEYERYHTLPGWYNDFKEFTVPSVWEDKGTVESAMNLTRRLEGSYIVKDYVKSRKHEWYDACFIFNIANKEKAEEVIRNFIERQGSDLAGGVVLRKYEKLKSIGFHEKSGMPISEEYRVYVFAGRIMITGDYWRSEKVSFTEEEKQWIESCVSKINSNFVTIDLARREDGRLIIMEMGDGQVSGLQQIAADDFYRAFNPVVLRLEDRPVESFPKDAVIIAREPMPDMTPDEMRRMISSAASTLDLVDAYVNVHNKFWFIEDDLYDYEKGTEEYEAVRRNVDAWGDLMEDLDKRIKEKAIEEGLYEEQGLGTVRQLKAFMNKYGYRDGRGWWIKK